MAFQVADRVKETTTTTGTGTLDLGGAASGFETFVAGIGNGNETYYVITDPNTGDFEVGVGTVTDAATDTLSRDSVITSSNAGSLVNFGAGTKDVFCSLPSERAIIIDDASNVEVTANITATSFDGSGAGLTTLNASNLASGTLPDARFPATLPGSSGANLTNLNASNVSSGTLNNARLSAVPNSALDNSSITINGTGVSLGGSINVGDITGVTAGDGLTGGGTTGAVTLNVGAGTLIDVAADTVSVDLSELTTSTSDADGDFFAVVDSANAQKKLTKGNINLSGFNNDAGFSTTTGTVTSVGVTAGSGLTGGGTITSSGTVTLNVGAGTGIDVAADAISVDVSDFMSNGSNNRVLTATGTDAMNAEANMTFDGSTLAVTGGATFTANVSLGDNDYIRLGASNDLLIYHDASHSYITDVGTGDLYIRGGADLRLQTPTSENGIIVNQDSSVQVYFNNAVKLTTTSTGIDVTGTVLTDKAYIALATLTDGATISWNMSTQSVAKVTLGGNRTMAAPTNGSTGQFASIIVIQDGTGTRTLTWNAVFEFKDDAAPTLTSTGGKGDLFVFQYNGSKWLEVGRNLNLTQS